MTTWDVTIISRLASALDLSKMHPVTWKTSETTALKEQGKPNQFSTLTKSLA
jgi:hypothetical protein